MTVREAIQVFIDGYGDDCPAGDDLGEAYFTLVEAGILSWEDVPTYLTQSTWPRPEPSPLTGYLLEVYRELDASSTPLLDALSKRLGKRA